MTNRLAIILAFIVIGALLFDHFVNDSKAITFLLRKGLELIAWMKFWR